MELSAESITPLTDGDLTKVFAYSEAPATVVILSRSKASHIKCETEEQWDDLIQTLPSVANGDVDSGLVLLIAPRILRNKASKSSKSQMNQCDGDEKTSQIDPETTAVGDEELARAGQRQTRVLPFSRDVFSRVAKAFYVHGSISRAINRADVPLFSHDDVFMQNGSRGVKARVYNCRSTNAWGGDLAMTVTHFPHCNLSFGILFGCTTPQKNYVLKRLGRAIGESGHPLLLPGIFVELERKRHHIIFESGVGKLESMIPGSEMEGLISQRQSGHQSDIHDRKTVYLEMLHLKHGLTTWGQQLTKMREHASTLNTEYFEALHPVNNITAVESSEDFEVITDYLSGDPANGGDAPSCEGHSNTRSSAKFEFGSFKPSQDLKSNREVVAKTNLRIIKRINAILEDYNDKIRECQTRFDGLTMTTQLFQGETSVLLALAASNDSRHMRTIALVTMVFLPGTFFATIFSMTFFNWQAGDGESTVSSLFWVYIVFSVVSTAATLLVYYYFVATRPKKSLGSGV
ncbi:hypothetical protein F4859DRAFT_479212 [Xylaria cf. heliscus]|nr:hypothetical protein F4859DRAFT_479212 [Xylaria cf. heliscus]